MTINSTYTDPSEAGAIDLDTNDVLTDTVWDLLLSNIKALGGTDGYTGTKYPVNGIATASTTVTTTSATFVDIDTMSVTLTAAKAGSKLLAILNLQARSSSNTDTETFAVSLDAATEVQDMPVDLNAGADQSITVVWLFSAVGAGSHTIKGRMKTTGGATLTVERRNLTVLELL